MSPPRLGRMPQAVWPRTPGRDWAGLVIEGPGELVGQEVFGAGGDLGITRDGTHASHLVVPRDAAVAKPAALTLAEAGALGVPFVTALQGFHRAGMPKPGDVVLVTAVNGMVGQAAAQIAAMHGALVFGVTRRAETCVQSHCRGAHDRRIERRYSQRFYATRPPAMAPTSSTTPSAVRTSRRPIRQWRMAGGRS